MPFMCLTSMLKLSWMGLKPQSPHFAVVYFRVVTKILGLYETLGTWLIAIAIGSREQQ